MSIADNDAGRGVSSPFQVPAQGWAAVLKRTWVETGDDNIGLIAAGIAFYAFAAIVPLLGAVVLSYGLFADADTVRRNVQTVFAAVPREAAAIITEQLLNVVNSSQDKQGIGLAVAIALAYYGATKGAGAIITGLNVAYDEQDRRGFIRSTLLNLGVVAGGVTAILLAVLATTLLAGLERLLPDAPGIVLTVIRLGGYLLLAGLVVTGVATLFRFGPDRRQPRWTWLSPGAAAATVAWLIGTSLFGLYVSRFGNYGATYGSLSAVVVLLTWLWLSAYIMLLGAELNAELERQVEGEAAGDQREAPPPADILPREQQSARSSPLPAMAVGGAITAAAIMLKRRPTLIVGLLATVATVVAWRARAAGSIARPEAVLFDIDGTLIDSNALHVEAWREAFAAAGHQIEPAVIRGQIGKGGDNLVPALLPGLPKAQQKSLAEAHGEVFKIRFIDQAQPFPHARDLVERVHASGLKVILASSASDEELQRYIDLLDIRHAVGATVSIDDVKTSKPAPDIFAVAVKKAGVLPSRAIAIGDTPYDVTSAGNAGVRTIGVLSGGFDRVALLRAGATAVYQDAGEVLRCFDESPLGDPRSRKPIG